MKDLPVGWADNALARDLAQAMVMNSQMAIADGKYISIEVFRESMDGGLKIYSGIAKNGMELDGSYFKFQTGSGNMWFTFDELQMYEPNGYTNYVFVIGGPR